MPPRSQPATVLIASSLYLTAGAHSVPVGPPFDSDLGISTTAISGLYCWAIGAVLFVQTGLLPQHRALLRVEASDLRSEPLVGIPFFARTRRTSCSPNRNIGFVRPLLHRCARQQAFLSLPPSAVDSSPCVVDALSRQEAPCSSTTTARSGRAMPVCAATA